MYNLGIVGLGQFGQFALSSYNVLKNCKIHSLCDLDPDLVNRFADMYQAKAYTSYSHLLKDPEVDIVILNTPNHLHFAQIIAALEAGRNVYCEKPLTTNTGDASQIFGLASKKGLFVGSDHTLIFSPIYQKLKEILSSEVDEIIIENLAAEGDMEKGWFWERSKSGGWFLNSSYHFFYLINFLLGDVKIVDAYEQVVEGKTRQTWVELTGSRVKKVLMYHHLFASKKDLGCKILIKSGGKRMQVTGWIPQKLELEGNELVSVSKSPDSEYQFLIREAFEDYLLRIDGGEGLVDESDIEHALGLCLEAQNKADQAIDN